MVDPAANFVHAPVMLSEVVELFGDAPGGDIVDATLGGAGHAAAVMTAHPTLRLHGFDHDPVARAAAGKRLEVHGERAHIHAARFDRCASVLAEAGVGEIAGFLMDLGVSSPQLDVAQRGFSYNNDGPLDMRMDPTLPLTAADVVNDYPVGELIDVLRSYGDERHAPRIARGIVAARPISSTAQLANIIRESVPAAARRSTGHPAKRSFQAIRIEVNSELEILGPAIDDLIDLLAPGGIGLVLTYHSGEDRIIKDHMRDAVGGDDLPGMPSTSLYEWHFRGARTPSIEEVEINPRARSARLRAIRRKELV